MLLLTSSWGGRCDRLESAGRRGRSALGAMSPRLLPAGAPRSALPAPRGGENGVELSDLRRSARRGARQYCRPRRARQVAATRAIRKKAETLSPESGEVLFFASFPPSPPRASNRACTGRRIGRASCRERVCQYV